VVVLSCRIWYPEKFIVDVGRSSVCFDYVAIHDEFSAVLVFGGVAHNTMSICVSQEGQRHHQPIRLMAWRLFCEFIYLNLVCLGWRDYIKCIAYVPLDLDMAMTEFISFNLDKGAANGRSMLSMYVDCGFDVLSLVAYPRVCVATSGMIEDFISICVAHRRQALVRWHVKHGRPWEVNIILRTPQEFQCIFDFLQYSLVEAVICLLI
jgi:hypothetical protein